jgi:hypothetical protein
MASGKIMSAPASTQAEARSMAACKPFGLQRVGAGHDDEIAESIFASTAALTRSTISDWLTRWPCRAGGRSASA